MKTFYMSKSKGDLILGFMLAILIITTGIVFAVFFKQLFYFDIDFLSLERSSGLTKDIIIQNYDSMIHYFSLWNRGPLTFPTLAMSTNGRIHFEEVKVIFDLIQIAFITSLAYTSYFGYQRYKDKNYEYLKIALSMILFLLICIVILLMFGFEQAFLLFHQVVFRNDYWYFDLRYDPVITILPEAFFFHSLILIIVVVCILCCVCLGVYLYQYNKVKKMKKI